MKTLVVEDEFTSRILLHHTLSHYGDCHIAVSGEEAVAAFQEALSEGTPYNLVCMDIRMSGMDGIEAVRQIRGIEEDAGVFTTQGAKILMVTAVEMLFPAMVCPTARKPLSTLETVSTLPEIAPVNQALGA